MSERGQRRVVCAANLHEGLMVIGPRHFDGVMRAQYEQLSSQPDRPVQGFIDQHGKFMTRTEAWKVAEAAGQILYRCGGDDANRGTLYSENLY